MTHSGTGATGRSHDRRLRTLVEPEAAFLAQLVVAISRPVRPDIRATPRSVSTIYAAVDDISSQALPHTTVIRRI